MLTRIHALVSEPVSGEALTKAVGREGAKDAEVLVVAPAMNTHTRFWHADVDAAVERRRGAGGNRRTDGAGGCRWAGDAGESDPLLAIQDALQTLPADEIVLFTHAAGT